MVRRIDKPIALALLLGAAACVPESYDGLTGGAKETPMMEDSALGAPRPLSPISVSMVATSRPKFRWELADTAGAVLELCRTRACEGELPKKFVANGQQLVVPEDLTPGMWFWRVRGRTDNRVGTDVSATWEVLVRGPAAHGSSEAPTGSVLDIDGDGTPDLVASLLAPGRENAKIGDPLFPWIGVFHGGEGGRIRTDDFIMGGTWSSRGEEYWNGPGADAEPPIEVSGGTDFNGDGFADFTTAGTDVMKTPVGPLYSVEVQFGSKDGWGDGYVLDLSNTIYPGVLASMKEAGDVNADGYGDLTVGGDDAGYLVLGAWHGLSASTLLFPGQPSVSGARPVLGAFDADGDGLGEVAVATSDLGKAVRHSLSSPVAAIGKAHLTAQALADHADPGATPLGRDVKDQLAYIARWGEPTANAAFRGLSAKPPPQSSTQPAARAFATGDLNGDGLSDVAVADNAGRVCLWFGDKEHFLVAGPCVKGLDGDVDFGQQLTAGDLEGDGVDDLVVSARAGNTTVLRTLTLDGDTVKVAAIEGSAGLGVRLTTIWPGRPGKARWAASAADGRRVVVFEGTSTLQVLERPVTVATRFGAALR